MFSVSSILGEHTLCRKFCQQLQDFLKNRGINIAIASIDQENEACIVISGPDWQITKQGISNINLIIKNIEPLIPASISFIILNNIKLDKYPIILLCPDKNERDKSERVLAVVSDREVVDFDGPRFGMNELDKLADYIWQSKENYRFSPQLMLWVNGRRIGMKEFVQQFFINTISGMISSLKTIDTIENVDIRFHTMSSFEKDNFIYEEQSE